MRKIIASHNDFIELQGKMIGCSPYFSVNQERISAFLASTSIKQQDGVVPELLLLSLTPYLWNKIVDIKNVNMVINYGLSELHFLTKVFVGENIKLVVWISNVHTKLGITKVDMDFCFEIKERNIKCIEGKAVFLYYFTGSTKHF